MKLVVCFQQVHSLRMIAWQIHCQRQIPRRGFFTVNRNETMRWIDSIPMGVVAGVVMGAVGALLMELVVHLWQRLNHCGFVGPGDFCRCLASTG